jgi:phage-related protein
VFHVITKKTSEQTAKRDIDVATKRYKEIVERHRKLEQEKKTGEPKKGQK